MYKWANYQRWNLRNDKLAAGCAELLRRLPGWDWGSKSDAGAARLQSPASDGVTCVPAPCAEQQPRQAGARLRIAGLGGDWVGARFQFQNDDLVTGSEMCAADLARRADPVVSLFIGTLRRSIASSVACCTLSLSSVSLIFSRVNLWILEQIYESRRFRV